MSDHYWLWVLIVLVLVVVLALLSLRMAKRIDRLHRRVQAGRVNLNRQLIKRAAETMRTADLDAVPERRAVLMRSAAMDSISLSGVDLVSKGFGIDQSVVFRVGDRLQAESRLSEVLRECLDEDLDAQVSRDPVSNAQLDALKDACRRTTLIRELHNQDVALTLALRSKPMARILHLAGTAQLPGRVDLDDQVV